MTLTALVTVGTTEFNDLIRGVDSLAVLKQLQKSGYHKLIVQHGNGHYKIRNILQRAVPDFEVECVSKSSNCAQSNDAQPRAPMRISHTIAVLSQSCARH